MTSRVPQEFDVVVVGSGGGGMAAALTAALRGLSTVVIEKAEHYGGSTALSGGVIWIPASFVLDEAGQADTIAKGRAYLEATVGDRVPAALREAYLTGGPAMVKELNDRTRWVRWDHVLGYPDYYAELPGGSANGRAHEARLIDARHLGDDRDGLQPGRIAMKGLVIAVRDARELNMFARTTRGKLRVLRVLPRALRRSLTGYDPLPRGQALIARMRLALRDAGVPVWTSTPFVDVIEEGDRVAGVRAVVDGEEVAIRARRGVILAAGGFSGSQEVRERYLPQPTDASWTMASPGQVGDALAAGLLAGAAVDLLDQLWGMPVLSLPDGALAYLVAERSTPGLMIVDGSGQRYFNEAAPYQEAVQRIYERHSPETPAIPSWLILDQRARNRYLLAGLFPRQPFPKRWVESRAVVSATTPRELAATIRVDPDRFEATLARYNAFARQGRDEDFHRGDSVYDRYFGDPTLPNPNLLALEHPPYYALKVLPGDIGTKGGLVTDVAGRVLRPDDTPIEGLYATGNCSASVMGTTYPGPGATIGPAMVFGYLAADHIAAQSSPSARPPAGDGGAS